VSLTKVSKKTKEHKNAMMNEVCFNLHQLMLYLTFLRFSLAANQCGQMALLLAIRGGIYEELPPEDCSQAMERVRLLNPSSFAILLIKIISAQHGCFLAAVLSWRRLWERLRLRSTRRVLPSWQQCVAIFCLLMSDTYNVSYSWIFSK
jgi:hypothetical protein